MTKIVVWLILLLNSILLASSRAVPIQLVAPDPTRSELQIKPDALKVLRDIPAPIAVLSIVGAVHSGKSFFLNALRGDASGFAVGYTVRPETAGLWMWSEPINVKGVNVLLLDTEGFYAPNVTESYDAKIYSIATLLSSEIVYNTVKFIDQQALEYLELLTRRANIFGLRAFADHPPADDASASVSELIGALLPTSLSWVVQDFVQDLQGQTPLRWLEELIDNPKTRFVNGNNSGPSSHSYNEGSTLKHLFTEIDCLALPPPVGNAEDLQKLDRVEPSNLSPDYTVMLDAYRSRLHTRLAKKAKLRANKTPMAGDDLAALVAFLVDAANGQRQRFPNVPPVWERFAELQMQYSKSDLLNVYSADTASASQSTLPLLESEAADLHAKVAATVLKLFESHIAGHHDQKYVGPAGEIKRTLENDLQQRGVDLLNFTCRRIHRHCEVARDDTLKASDRKLQTLLGGDCPLSSPSLESKLNHERDEAISQFHDSITVHNTKPYDKSKCCHLEEFNEMLERRFDEARATNERRIDDSLREAFDESQMILNARLSLADTVDSTPSSAWKPEVRAIYQTSEGAFGAIVDSACREAVDVFELAVRPLMSLEKGLHIRRQVDVVVQEARVKARRRWDEYCAKECATIANGAVMRLPAHVRRSMPMPCLEEQIQAAAMESLKQAELDFRQIHCVESEGWRTAYAKLLVELDTAINEVKQQNINAIKEMSKVPLDALKRELIAEASNHYWWYGYHRLAVNRAIEVLNEASTRRSLQSTAALINKVAESFTADDLHEAKGKIAENLFNFLGIVSIIAVLLYSGIRSVSPWNFWTVVLSFGTIGLFFVPILRPFLCVPLQLEFWFIWVTSLALRHAVNEALLWWILVVCILVAQGVAIHRATAPPSQTKAPPHRPSRAFRPSLDQQYASLRNRQPYNFGH